jgi:SAM-dependent methyltransferase
VGALPSDYDSDPERWASLDPSTQWFGDVHERVAAIITGEGAAPTLDVGGGDGRLEKCLPADWPSIILDNSPTQLVAAPDRKLLGDAVALPVRHGIAGSVAMLWMLYHLDQPVRAVEEARRVLRPGGLFVACTSSRRNDPELTGGCPATGFDAEEAGSIVSMVFDEVSVESWDAKLTYLPDRDAVLRYCRSHVLPASAAERVTPPLWLTKRGCLVIARR